MLLEGAARAGGSPGDEPGAGVPKRSSAASRSSNGAVATSNVSTEPFPASPEGDAMIRATVALPDPCVAPIVFVTSPTGAWFAATGVW